MWLLVALCVAVFARGIARHLRVSDEYDTLANTQTEILRALRQHSNDADKAWAAAFEVTSAISCCRPPAPTTSSSVGFVTVTDGDQAKRSAAAAKIAAAASRLSAPAASSGTAH
jgi:hypothetical protein